MYAVVCTFRGGAIPTKMTFQVDTAGTFAASEKAVAALGVVAVHDVGRAAWAPKAGGDLNVFTGSETIKILAPLVSPPRSRRWPRSSSNPLSRP